MRRSILLLPLLLLLLLPLATSCVREDTFDNTPEGNFEALWKIID